MNPHLNLMILHLNLTILPLTSHMKFNKSAPKFNKSALKFNESALKFNESAPNFYKILCQFYKIWSCQFYASKISIMHLLGFQRSVSRSWQVFQALSPSSKSVVSQSVIRLISKIAYKKLFISWREVSWNSSWHLSIHESIQLVSILISHSVYKKLFLPSFKTQNQ